MITNSKELILYIQLPSQIKIKMTITFEKIFNENVKGKNPFFLILQFYFVLVGNKKSGR